MKRLKLFCVYLYDDMLSFDAIKPWAFFAILIVIVGIILSLIGILRWLPNIGFVFIPFWFVGMTWSLAAWAGNILLGWLIWPVVLFTILESFGKTFYFPNRVGIENGDKKYEGRIATFTAFKVHLMYVSAILGISFHLLVMPIVNYAIMYPTSYSTGHISTHRITESFRTYSFLPYYNSKNEEFLRVLGLTDVPEGSVSEENIIKANQLCRFGKVSKIVCKEIKNKYQ